MGKGLSHKRKGGYIRKWEVVLASPAYRDLSPPARCLLDEFQRIYRPGRNGKLSISTSNAAKLINVSQPTASKAFYELVEHGFLILVQGQLWMERKAREWRLTIEEYNGREPTDEWRQWERDKPVAVKPLHKKLRVKKHGQDCSKNEGRLLKKQGQRALKAVVSH